MCKICEVLCFNISIEDVNAIKKLIDLATSRNNTFISLTNKTVQDTFNNSVIEIPPDMAERAVKFMEDTTEPLVVTFLLDGYNVYVHTHLYSQWKSTVEGSYT